MLRQVISGHIRRISLNETKIGIIIFLLSIIPYLCVAGAYMEFTGGHAMTFLIAFVLLSGLRLFFALIECVGSILVWRLYGREIMVRLNLRLLKENRFPMRYYRHDDFLNYLSRIKEDYASSSALKCEVKVIEAVLAMSENSGIFVSARLYHAFEIALERYSPRDLAPVMSFD